MKLDYCSTYKYLGVVFDEHLNFKENAVCLAQSGNRALGSVVAKYKKNTFIGFSTYTKIYNSCVCPIIDYGSAVWGYNMYKEIDKVQQKAQRIFMGVHRFAPLLGLEGDTGWLSPKHRRWIEMVRFWNRMLLTQDNRLVKQLFAYDYERCERGKNNWCSNVKEIFHKIDLSDKYTNKDTCDLRLVKKSLLDIQEKWWKDNLPTKPKLRFYSIFKTELCTETYVMSNLLPSERSLLAQFRFGILPLRIETGRFVNMKEDERICQLCKGNEVEDEHHFLFVCPLYNDLRESMFHEIVTTTPDFVYFDYTEQLKLLFIQFYRKLAKYTKRAFERRKLYIYT